MCCWQPWEPVDEGDVLVAQVRRVGGLRLVDVPGGPLGVAHGDVVEMPEDRALVMAGTGEWELVSAGPDDESGD